MSSDTTVTGEETEARLHEYLNAVLQANREFNLTAVRDENLAWSKHVLDALQALGKFDSPATALFDGQQKVIDVGTGAGFPGVVLAIARHQLQVTLLEATRKKCNFLEAATTARAPNARVLCARAEEAGHEPELREQFDVAVARAVGSFPEVCELCLPFVRNGGNVLLWRGQYAPDEVAESKRAVHSLGGQARVLSSYQLPDHDTAYHLVLVQKTRPTPPMYPRRVGLPKHQPL